MVLITNILGSIDNRIAISRKIVSNITQFLDFIYKYYFGNKCFASNSVLGNFLNVVSGYPFDSSSYANGKYKIITIKAIQPDHLDTTNADHIVDKPNDLDSVYELKFGDVLISLTGNTGRMAIVDEENALLNQRVGKLVSNVDFAVYGYCLFHSAYMQEIIARNSVGTSQKNVSPIDIQKISVYKPTSSELEVFNNIAIPIFNLLVSEFKRIKKLLEYKNTILPLLMNRQVVVR